MDKKVIGTWCYLIGTVLALLTVFVELGDWATYVLIVLGFLAGMFHARDNLIKLGITYLALTAAANSMDELIVVGPYVSNIAAAWVGFLGPVVLTAFMVWATPDLVTNKESSD